MVSSKVLQQDPGPIGLPQLLETHWEGFNIVGAGGTTTSSFNCEALLRLDKLGMWRSTYDAS